MATWLVFGEQVIGRVEARHRDEAQALAYQRYPTAPISRVQSEASYQISLEERRAAAQRRLLRRDEP
jgi:hypothetical protein